MPLFKHKKYTHFLISGLVAISVVLVAVSIGVNLSPNDTGKAARVVERSLARRIAALEAFASLYEGDYEEKIISNLPEDMVIYYYKSDSLKVWNHQFPIMNDDISQTVFLQKLVSPSNEIISPMSFLTSKYTYVNFGPSWYLARRISTSSGGVIVMGLEMSNSLKDETMNGINRHFDIGGRFSFRPLSFTGGVPVRFEGEPVFKVICETISQNTLFDTSFVWAAYLLLMCAALLFLLDHSSIRRYLIASPIILGSSILMMVWGAGGGITSRIFSPVLYADGVIFYSLGALLLLNVAIVLSVICIHLIRHDLERVISSSRHSRLWHFVEMSTLALLILGLYILVWVEFKSISINSSISFELSELSELSPYTFIVYASLISLMAVSIHLISMLTGIIMKLYGVKDRGLTSLLIVITSFMMALYLVCLSVNFGLRREQDRVAIWANRLSIDRDISMELSLLKAENAIATDTWLATLTVVSNSEGVIANRLSETYFHKDSQDYDILAFISGPPGHANGIPRDLLEYMGSGIPIADGSMFMYFTREGTRAVYYRMFSYLVAGQQTHLLLVFEPKVNKKDRGYGGIIKTSSPGKVSLPKRYSYAKYIDNTLMSVNGAYTYPTVIKGVLKYNIYDTDLKNVIYDGYFHYLNRISDDEVIIISRPRTGAIKYCFNLAFLSVAIFITLALATRYYGRRKRLRESKTYYKTRVTTILVVSLVGTLLVMASASVAFVSRHNNNNIHALMMEKLDAVQSLLYTRFEMISGTEELMAGPVVQEIRMVGEATSTDVSLFSTEGRILATTAPYVYEKNFLGSRIDENALHNIIDLSRRYYFSMDRYGHNKYHTLYAPAYNKEGEVLAIMACPYVSPSYDMEEDAIQHLMIIFTIFLILLLLARFFTTAVVDNIFNPLYEMGRKMNSADIGSLEYIKYENDDEITALVESYNRMVKELMDSTQKLAQAERDKAWSAMARQVAHEIKNPLTPMKLQIQRLIRLRQKEDPSWQEKFVEISEMLLDHIDMLSETASEFSTFAKLYTESATAIDLDAILKEEVSMFDNKGDVHIEYIGFDHAAVMGPKPQLSRVFINLLGNAVQAVSDLGQRGEVRVSLRKSMQDGYYDILFEDNGAGVSEENMGKLFTPNFTTKTGGTGLGLAISKSVLDKCNATIKYSRSFSLGGACFTIVYPVNGEQSAISAGYISGQDNR